MASLTEKYIYDVIRRLPEKEREDVKRELTANIYDMLPDNPTEEQIKAVLTELGSPALLARGYRQSKQYLIGPTFYNEYIRALKWVVPLVAIIMLVVGLALGALGSLNEGMVSLADFFTGMISQGISSGLTGAFQALFWVTIGFIIADGASAKNLTKVEEWTVNDLENIIPDEKDRISLSDSIVELVVVVVFSVLFLAWLMDMLPFGFAIIDGNTRITQLFSPGFIAVCIPIAIILCLVCVAECISKIIARRWTPVVSMIIVASNLVSVGLILYLVSAPEILNPEVTTYFLNQEWTQSLDNLWIIGGSFEKTILFVVAVVVFISGLAESAYAIYKTVRTKNAQVGVS